MLKSMQYILYETQFYKLCLRWWILIGLETKVDKMKLKYARERIKNELRKKGNIL